MSDLDIITLNSYTFGMKNGIKKTSNVKTAISIQESLFEQAEALAKEMHISRSRLFMLALKDFIHRYQSRQLLERIDAAYDDAPAPSEKEFQRHMRSSHKRIVEDEW
ncbi:MAG: hypothetical protein ACMUIL_01810 [bacterium]